MWQFETPMNVAEKKYAYFLTFVVLTITYIIYRWLAKPLNRVKLLGDVGFYLPSPQPEGRIREAQIRRVRRLRVIGNIPPVYPNGWFCVAESSQIKLKEVRPVIIFGLHLTLIRSESGSIHLIDSYCPHLGASFSVGGRVVDNNCVQCPFHGWIFSGETGKCTKIPYSAQKIPEQAKVSVWPVKEINKHIYVWYHCDGRPPEWEIPEIEEVRRGEWVYKGRTEHEIQCHIQELQENGADIAHLNYLHLSGVNNGNDITKIKMELTEPIVKHLWDGRWEQQPDPNEHVAIMFLEQVMTIMNRHIPFTTSKLQARQIGPGIVYMMFDFGWIGRGCVMHHATPEEPMLQRARFVMYSDVHDLFAKFFMISEAHHQLIHFESWSYNRSTYMEDMRSRNAGAVPRSRIHSSDPYTT